MLHEFELIVFLYMVTNLFLVPSLLVNHYHVYYSFTGPRFPRLLGHKEITQKLGCTGCLVHVDRDE